MMTHLMMSKWLRDPSATHADKNIYQKQWNPTGRKYWLFLASISGFQQNWKALLLICKYLCLEIVTYQNFVWQNWGLLTLLLLFHCCAISFPIYFYSWREAVFPNICRCWVLFLLDIVVYKYAKIHCKDLLKSYNNWCEYCRPFVLQSCTKSWAVFVTMTLRSSCDLLLFRMASVLTKHFCVFPSSFLHIL